MKKRKKLYRSSDNLWLNGVFGGIGEYYNIDPNLLRFLFVVLLFTDIGGVLFFAYIVLCLLIPK